MSAALLEHFALLAASEGGVAKLRELILSLAVRGKLVPQDPADKPASELLGRIRTEKERLVAEGKIKREKPTQPIGEEEKPFELPEGWEWVRLGEVIEVIRGITFPANEKTKEPATGRIACLRTANVQHHIEWDDLLFVDRSFMGREEQLIALHDIVMSMANSRELVGKVAFVDRIPTTEATFGGFLSVLRPHLISPHYAMILLRTEYARTTLIDSSSQTTNIANISLAKLRPLPVPVPTLPEQSRIVAKVEALMALCDRLEAQQGDAARVQAHWTQAALDQLAESSHADEFARNWQALAEHFDTLFATPASIDALDATLLQLAVRGKLVPQNPADEPASELLKKIRAEKDRLIAEGKIKRDKPLPPIADDEKPFELPEGWAWARLGTLLSKIGAGSTPLGGKDVYTPSGIKFLRSQNIWNEGLRLSDVAFIPPEIHKKMAGTVVLANDILFNITGASIGRCALVPDDFDEANVSQHVTIIRLASPEITHFLHLVLISRHVQQTVMDVQVGVSREGLSIGKLGQFLIPIPPLHEQSRIVAKLDELLALTRTLRARLTEVTAVQARFASALVDEVAA